MSDENPTIKRLSAGRVECLVTFADSDVSTAEEGAIKKLGSEIKLDGFRAGHAPASALREKINPEALFEETVRILLPDTFEMLVKEHNIKPIISPRVDVDSQSPLTLKITFIEKPEVKLKSVKKIKIEKKKAAVDEREVEKMINYILNQHQTTKEVERAAKKEDKVLIDFWGEDEEGKEIDGTRSLDYEIVIGSKMLIPGFEDELVGLEKEEKKDFSITFPEKYQAEHLRNTSATFHVTMKKVEEVSKPELTDKFAKENLGVASVEEFNKQIENSMQKQEEDTENKRREQEAMEAIRRATEVEIAPELISDEKQSLIEELAKQLEQYGMSIEQWLEQQQKKPEDAEKEFEAQAKQRLELRLGMEKYVEEKEVEVTDDEMEKAIKEMLEPVPADQRLEIAPAYAKGAEAYEQFKWQKRVEKALAMLIE